MTAEMRRKDRQLSEEEAYELLRKAEYGILSTVCPDGTPYGLPISFVLDGNVIYMHCSNQGGQKLINIQNSSAACFTVIGQTQLLPEAFSTRYMSAMAFGRIRIVEDAIDKRKGIEAILYRYSPEYIEKGMKYIDAAINKIHILRLDIERITAKGRK